MGALQVGVQLSFLGFNLGFRVKGLKDGEQQNKECWEVGFKQPNGASLCKCWGRRLSVRSRHGNNEPCNPKLNNVVVPMVFLTSPVRGAYP